MACEEVCVCVRRVSKGESDCGDKCCMSVSFLHHGRVTESISFGSLLTSTPCSDTYTQLSINILYFCLLFSSSHSLSVLFSLFLSSSLSPSLFLCHTDKLFGKRLLQAGRHIMSHKSWMKTVPTENCDVLMTFAGAGPADTAKGLTSAQTYAHISM